MIKKPEALKGVSISCVEEIVDQAMEHLPATLDLALSENRAKMRLWMVRICNLVIQETTESFKKASSSAIDEAAALAINPDYYRHKRKQMERRKAARAVQQCMLKPKNKAEIDFFNLKDTSVRM